MCDPKKFFTIHEAAEVLHLNPEVVRRWLRSGKLAGTKIGNDWRVPETAFERLFHPASGDAQEAQDNGPKMCIKFPKWLEFSGLPKQLNTLLGPLGWLLFRKLVELDFEQGESTDYKVTLDLLKLCERIGCEKKEITLVLKGLAKNGFVTLDEKHVPAKWFKIQTPLKTPKPILDIHFTDGGVKGAPEKAFESRCLRRYLV